MTLSCCIWALTGPETDILTQIANLGFQSIDIQPGMLATDSLRTQAQNQGLGVSCMGVSFGLPPGASLDSQHADSRRAALEHMERAFAHAAMLGARAAYTVPGVDGQSDSLARYGESLAAAADLAQAHGLTLSVEHFPGRALATAGETLDFLGQIGHPNLYLLLDLGHIQLSREDPAAVIRRAGSRLGYVHLDDNDGVGDLHWALLDGVMSETTLTESFAALAEIGYVGPVSLELSPNLPNPRLALQRSREIVLPWIDG